MVPSTYSRAGAEKFAQYQHCKVQCHRNSILATTRQRRLCALMNPYNFQLNIHFFFADADPTDAIGDNKDIEEGSYKFGAIMFLGRACQK